MYVLVIVQLVADYVCKTYQKMTILSYVYITTNGGKYSPCTYLLRQEKYIVMLLIRQGGTYGKTTYSYKNLQGHYRSAY